MPKLTNALPSMRRHASGQAIVTLNNRDRYLGKYGSAEAKLTYDRLISEWLANGRREVVSPDEVTVGEIIAGFIAYARDYYRRPDGSPTNEIDNFIGALKPLNRLYGETKAVEFGPLALRCVRDEMVKVDWARSQINKNCGRIRRVFKWAVGREMLPAHVHQALQAVEPLKAGRTTARETKPVKPVAEAHARAIYSHVSAQVADMIELALITGMRAGEIVTMRGRDIDTTGKLWTYKPQQHKTRHHGHDRVVMLGPKAQEILKRYLRTDLDAPLFSPAAAEADRRLKQHAARKTPMSCGNRPGSCKTRKRKRPTGHRYTVASFCRAIKYGCAARWPAPERETVERLARELKRPGLTLRDARKKVLKDNPKLAETIKAHDKAHSFHPHQLRHTAATRLRKEFGIEAAQVMLGHKTIRITELYAEKNLDAARKIAAEVG